MGEKIQTHGNAKAEHTKPPKCTKDEYPSPQLTPQIWDRTKPPMNIKGRNAAPVQVPSLTLDLDLAHPVKIIPAYIGCQWDKVGPIY